MPRIGIDGRAFTSPAAGVRRYATQLVSALMELGEPLQIVALGGDAAGGPPGIEHIAEPAHPPTNLGWTLIGLPAAAARARVDLIHAPAYTAPLMPRVNIVACPVPSHGVNMSGMTRPLPNWLPWHTRHMLSGVTESPEPPAIMPRQVPAVIVIVLAPSVTV